MESEKRIRILDIPVDLVNMREAVDSFSRLMEEPDCSLIVTPNSEIIMNASKDPVLREVIESAELIIPDGIGLVYASKILGMPLRERVTGIDFLEMILIWLQEHGKSIFIMGSKPGADGKPGIAELAAQKMQEKYKDLKIAGTHHGYFQEADEAELVEKINASGADFLCVALGSPKQELFVNRNREQLNVRGAIGVGGSLDVWSGTLKRAPEFYQKHGLEWLYRLVQEPTRYKRMAAIPLFMLKVLKTKGGSKHVD